MIKKTIRIVTVLVVLALILWSASKFMKPRVEELTANSCNMDPHALLLEDPENKLKTDKEVVQAVFDHYFSFYVDKKKCLDTSIKAAQLESIGKINHDTEGHFIANIMFALQPTSMPDTKWITSESSTTTDGWIKNKKGALSIRTASSTYYLVI